MRAILTRIYVESGYTGVQTGVVAGGDSLLVIDAPLRSDDAREWLADLNEVGRPRYLAVLDHHPDRVLGSRNLDVPRLAQNETAEYISRMPDAYKGSANPVGSDADRIKRVTGMSKIVPDLTFNSELTLHLDGQDVVFWHRPGPTPGSMWVVLEDRSTVFIGDTVTVAEPPYLGFADVDAWLAALDELRDSGLSDFKYVTGRDGLVDRDAINDMARFLRKIPVRLERLEGQRDIASGLDSMADELVDDFRVVQARKDLCRLRLKTGMERLYRRDHPDEA